MTTRSTHQRGAACAAVVALAVGLTGLTAVPAAAGTVSEPIADGLVTPLGLAVGSDGTFYVAEAFANTLTKIDRRGNRSVVDTPAGSTAGVDALGRGTLVYTVTGFPETEDEPPPTFLHRVTPAGKPTVVASPSAHEEQQNPDSVNTYGFADVDEECLAQIPPFVPSPYPGIVESNPYSVAITPGGWVVADAAANTVLQVRPNGRISTLAVLPPVPQTITAEIALGFGLPDCVIGQSYYGEPVPTDVEVGPDGHYYVSTLPGAPELPGTGAVWRVDANSGALTQVAGGFTGAVDIAVAADGTIYVAELGVTDFSTGAPVSTGGQISVISAAGVSVLAEVNQPGAVEIGRDGTLYATVDVLSETGGSLVQVTP